MTLKNNTSSVISYYEQLRQALNHYDDPAWLGENSPLAAPYFLGHVLNRASATADWQSVNGRGKQLQQAILNAADLLWGTDPLPRSVDELQEKVTDERRSQGNKGARYHFLLLELRYFRRYFKTYDHPLADQEQDIRDFVGVGRGPYFNHAKAARQALGDALLTYVQPTFRLERPPLTMPLIGRDTLLDQSLVALKAGDVVALNGAGGNGKTAVAASLVACWPAAAFWYTLRPSVNDELNSLLFSLGYFLHQQGSSNLWRQLIADGGKIEGINLALGHIRGDLALLEARPLLVFDELDHLRPEQDISNRHVTLREFLISLAELVPVLFLSQQPTLVAAHYHQLPGLDKGETAALLEQANILYTAEELRRLHEYTAGNPRLLHLCLGLHTAATSVTDILAKLPTHPDLAAIFDQLWQQFTPDERQLVQQLAVFQTPAPDDHWPQAESSLQRLTAQHIVQRDGRGGIFLLPVLYDLLNHSPRWLSAEQREHNHLLAAGIRATRGEYTAAAHHFVEAGEHSSAIHSWFTHREQEIRRGQGGYALSIFQPLSLRRLDKREQEALALIRAELYALLGDPTSGRAEIEAVSWSAASELALQAQQRRGDFLNALGYPDEALDTYNKAIETTGRLLNQLGRLHYQRGIIHVQQRQLDAAGQEALLARYQAEHLQALVHDEQGRYEEAHTFYQRALALAEEAQYKHGLAQTNRELAAMLARQSKIEEALAAGQIAIDYYQEIGDRFGQEKMRNVLAAIYFQAGQFEQVISTAALALAFFEQAKLPYWSATTAATLSEAHYENGDLEQAERYAHQALNIEEPQSHPYALYTLGLVAAARAQFSHAVQFFQQSQTSATTNGDQFMAAYAWRMVGKTQRQLGQHDDATAALQQAYAQFLALGVSAEAEATQALISIKNEK